MKLDRYTFWKFCPIRPSTDNNENSQIETLINNGTTTTTEKWMMSKNNNNNNNNEAKILIFIERKKRLLKRIKNTMWKKREYKTKSKNFFDLLCFACWRTKTKYHRCYEREKMSKEPVNKYEREKIIVINIKAKKQTKVHCIMFMGFFVMYRNNNNNYKMEEIESRNHKIL